MQYPDYGPFILHFKVLKHNQTVTISLIYAILLLEQFLSALWNRNALIHSKGAPLKDMFLTLSVRSPQQLILRLQ